ncbi:hypothetical protein WG907_05175 [Sphingobium sp. AN558]|uniref:hypothetical protein n=1 Tax=Sphingobium sp. AN558 TaxID=3133442 RepID=UPI0030BFC365
MSLATLNIGATLDDGKTDALIQRLLKVNAAIEAFNALALDGTGQGAGMLARVLSTLDQVPGTIQRELDNWTFAGSMFGADPTGVLPSATPIQNAINRRLTLGGDLELNRGVYIIDHDVNFTDFVRFNCRGRYATVLLFTTPTAVINAMAGAEFHNVRMHTLAGVTRTMPFVMALKNAARFKGCAFSNYYRIAQIGLETSTAAVNVRVSDILCFNPQVGAGSGGFHLRNIASFQSDHVIATGYYGQQQPDYFWRIWQGDTFTDTSSNITGHGNAVLIDTPAGYNIYAAKSVNCLYDSAGLISGGAAASNVALLPRGGIHSFSMTGGWAGLAAAGSGILAQPVAGGLINAMQITGTELLGNAVDGILMNALDGSINESLLNGLMIGGNGYGWRILGSPRNITAGGSRIGSVSGRGPNLYGIYAADGCDPSGLVATNNVNGNTYENVHDGALATSAFSLIANAGYNDKLPIQNVPAGAGPTLVYTAGHTREILGIEGGSVSDVKVRSYTIAARTGVSVPLDPLEPATITFNPASPPTITRMRKM